MITRDYKTLDAILVVGCLGLLAYAMWALVTREIPQSQLAILSGIVGATVGAILTAYAGSRWGNKKPAEDTHPPGAPGTASVSLQVDTAPAKPVDGVVKPD